jgi:hypothetical protein
MKSTQIELRFNLYCLLFTCIPLVALLFFFFNLPQLDDSSPATVATVIHTRLFDNIQLYYKKERDVYSHHQCYSNLACVLHNVQLDEREGVLIYYYAKTIPLALGHLQFGMNIRFVEGHPVKTVIFEEGTFIFAHNKCPPPQQPYQQEWTVWNTMVDTGLLSEENQLVLLGCQQKTFSKTWFTISKQIHTLASFRLENSGKILENVLLMTNQPRPIVTPYLIKLFRDRVYHLYGIHQTINNDKPVIAIRYEPTHFPITNHREILSSLRVRFPQCQVLEFYPESMGKIEEEVKFMSQVDVYLTLSLEGSYSQQFIRDGALVITPDTCKVNDLNHMECTTTVTSIWDKLPYYFRTNIQPTRKEDLKKESNGQYSYMVHVDDMTEIVQESLIRAGYNLTVISL